MIIKNRKLIDRLEQAKHNYQLAFRWQDERKKKRKLDHFHLAGYLAGIDLAIHYIKNL